jgi:antitoxin component YwqK of YwqJK toxin-antitoxin module
VREEDGREIRDGWWREYYINGQPSEEGEYADGQRVGFWIFWYPNGLKRAEGTYVWNLPSGRWEFWTKTGEPIEMKRQDNKPVPQGRIGFGDFARNLHRDFK